MTEASGKGHAARARLWGLGMLLCGLVVGSGAQAAGCSMFGVENRLPVLVNPKLAARTTLLCNRSYAALHSGLAHEPLWSAERLTEEDLEGAVRVGRVTRYFHADSRLPDGDGARLSDYRGSGYDRGHLTPSGDAADRQAQEQTFSLANVVPQTPALNEGIWAGVEMAVRDLVHQDGSVYVATGPAFDDDVRAIGSDNVFVPAATWKAIYDPVSGRSGAYVCRNTETPTCTTLSIAQLVSDVGIDPFPALSNTVKAQPPDLPRPEASPYRPHVRDVSRERQSYGQGPDWQAVRRAGREALRALSRKWEEKP